MNTHCDLPAALRVCASVRTGTFAEYAALAAAHYRRIHPATHALVLVAEVDGRPAGALVVSFPALCGPWRDIAWPGRFPRIADLNMGLRVISRVVVAPEHRGMGIACMLVRHYLQSPLTPCTEALSAMAICTPLFTRAGMRRIDYPPARRVGRLLTVLDDLGIEPWMLADLEGLLAGRWCQRRALPELEGHLRCFARAHRDTRELALAPIGVVIKAVLARIGARPVAHVHGP